MAPSSPVTRSHYRHGHAGKQGPARLPRAKRYRVLAKQHMSQATLRSRLMKFLDFKHLLAVPSEPKDLSTEITRRFHVKSFLAVDTKVVQGKPRAPVAQILASHGQQHLERRGAGQRGPPGPLHPNVHFNTSLRHAVHSLGLRCAGLHVIYLITSRQGR